LGLAKSVACSNLFDLRASEDCSGDDSAVIIVTHLRGRAARSLLRPNPAHAGSAVAASH